MSREDRAPVAPGGSDTCDQLRPSEEGLEAWPDSDTVKGPPAGRRLLRVLVVDDDRDTADSMAVLVQMWGHDVRTAYDAAAALEMTCAYRPHVLLLDIAMPKMDGCRLARLLRRQSCCKDALLVAITGYADQAHRLLGQEAGFDHYLIKPVGPAAVEKLLLLQQDRLAASPETPPGTPRKYGILVVDHEEGVRGVLNAGMEQQGFAVWLAAEAQAALDLYLNHRQAIDVVLVDVRMPGRDGPRTLAALREMNPRMRCCFMSADLGSYAEWKLLTLGAAAVIRKPARAAEVAQFLWDLVSNAGER